MQTETDDDAAVDQTRRGALLTGAAAAAGLLAAGAATAQSPAAPSPRPLKIVLHVSDPDGWPPALSNAKNLAAQHPEIRVRIVTDGGGVYGLQGANDLTALMATVAKGGV